MSCSPSRGPQTPGTQMSLTWPTPGMSLLRRSSWPRAKIREEGLRETTSPCSGTACQ